ncbi:regenerating islet-derived protein 3-gamma-like isoform X2 [Suncus etruscus]|uniref:regenerating islet-derived protein 3-gamma-like isoform X2 n=1 Tax=Suncus etruscus TaxID=109475 RepID=UPI00210FB674|nr:regenerating islet-derived protein 3-gamma-like isoform X2 [Suncus etruscus]
MLPSAALSTISWMLLSCLMLISQVQGEDVVKSLPAARITCPKGSVAYFSYCYALYTTPAAWMDAEGNYPNGGGWMWSSTDVMNYQIWEKRPPTNPNFGFCGSVTQSSGFRKWKDYNCDIKLPYVCKFKN